MTGDTQRHADRFAFQLPRGYADASGEVHRDGVMRLATAHGTRSSRCARVEGAPEPGGLTVALLAGRSPGSGPSREITPELIEELYAADFDHLQRLYERINTDEGGRL